MMWLTHDSDSNEPHRSLSLCNRREVIKVFWHLLLLVYRTMRMYTDNIWIWDQRFGSRSFWISSAIANGWLHMVYSDTICLAVVLTWWSKDEQYQITFYFPKYSKILHTNCLICAGLWDMIKSSTLQKCSLCEFLQLRLLIMLIEL